METNPKCNGSGTTTADTDDAIDIILSIDSESVVQSKQAKRHQHSDSKQINPKKPTASSDDSKMISTLHVPRRSNSNVRNNNGTRFSSSNAHSNIENNANDKTRNNIVTKSTNHNNNPNKKICSSSFSTITSQSTISTFKKLPHRIDPPSVGSWIDDRDMRSVATGHVSSDSTTSSTLSIVQSILGWGARSLSGREGRGRGALFFEGYFHDEEEDGGDDYEDHC